jgi:hypothetical protein
MKKKHVTFTEIKEHTAIRLEYVFYLLMNLCFAIGSVLYISNHFMQSNQGVTSVLFGGMLLLIIVRYLGSETLRCNPFQFVKVSKEVEK